jgi:hypothetical protein
MSTSKESRKQIMRNSTKKSLPHPLYFIIRVISCLIFQTNFIKKSSHQHTEKNPVIFLSRNRYCFLDVLNSFCPVNIAGAQYTT